MKELSEENILIRMNWNYKGLEAEESDQEPVRRPVWLEYNEQGKMSGDKIEDLARATIM